MKDIAYLTVSDINDGDVNDERWYGWEIIKLRNSDGNLEQTFFFSSNIHEFSYFFFFFFVERAKKKNSEMLISADVFWHMITENSFKNAYFTDNNKKPNPFLPKISAKMLINTRKIRWVMLRSTFTNPNNTLRIMNCDVNIYKHIKQTNEEKRNHCWRRRKSYD